MDENSVLYSKKIPVRYNFDVVVIGGGIAGVCAACAAADRGAKTLLIERFAFLGGNGTIGGVTGFCGESMGQGHIFDEIIADLEKFDAIAPHFYQRDVFMKGRWYDHMMLAIVLQELVLKRGVKLLLHGVFLDVIEKDGEQRVETILVWGKSGLFAVKGKFFIDASGEADLVAAMGGAFLNDGRFGYKLPMSINFFIRRGSPFNKRNIPPDFFTGLARGRFENEDDLPMISFGKHARGIKSVKIKIPKYDPADTEQLTAAEIESHREVVRFLDYYKNKKRRNWELDYFSAQIGIREGRRILGEYVLTVGDVKAGRTFPDAVAVGTFPLDAHKPDDNKRTYILPKSELRVPPYNIPLRALIPKNTENILVAGRNLSADQLAMSSARVMTTCAMMGEAAGVVAAYCSETGISPLRITERVELMEDIRRILIKNGMWLDPSRYK